MPVDAYDDEDEGDGKTLGIKTRFKEFNCPDCDANNPVEFGHGDELLCNYCGTSFMVKVNEDGKPKLRER